MPKILVAPGSGDIHWVMLKMEGIIETHFKGEKSEVWIWSESRRTERSADYVKRIPFVTFGGYYHASPLDVKVGQQVFVGGDPWIRMPWKGFDMFVAFNAPLGRGESLVSLMPKCKTNWDYKIHLTFEDQHYGFSLKRKHWPYVATSFFGHSLYKGWLKHFGVDRIEKLYAEIRKTHTIIHTGCEWDVEFMAPFVRSGDVNLLGKTSMGQLLGLMKHADAFIGFAAGNGMLAQHLGTKTFMLWDPDHWCSAFMLNWVETKRFKEGVYRPLSIKQSGIIKSIVDNLQ